MKKVLIFIVVLLVSAMCFGQDLKKVWVSLQYEDNGFRVLYIEDRETGTRCYAIRADSETSYSGFAISCVPKR